MFSQLMEKMKRSRLQEAAGDLCRSEAEADRTPKQKEVKESRDNILQRIRELQQQQQAIDLCADEAVERSQKIFNQMALLLSERSEHVRQQLRSQQQSAVSEVRELQEKLEQEMEELKRRDVQLEQLSHTEDLNSSLHSCASLSPLGGSTHQSSIKISCQRAFEEVLSSVVATRDKLQDILREKPTNISATVSEVAALPPQQEEGTRAALLKFSRPLTLDPETADYHLLLSKDNREATFMNQIQPHPGNSHRFTGSPQVLSRETLTDSCYFEVAWEGSLVYVAVAYGSIRRKRGSKEVKFGDNNKSWALRCVPNGYRFIHNEEETKISGPVSFRVGVFLDHSEGILSFYNVSETSEITLLHTIQIKFTQPLHVGLYVYDAKAEI